MLLAVALLATGCRPLAGPEAEIAHALEALAARAPRFVLADDGSALELQRARFDRLLVKPDGDGFVAIATVDAEARWLPPPPRGATAAAAATAPAPPVRVSYLGVERIPFVRDHHGAWRPRGAPLPALADIARLLAARLAALERGGADVAGTGDSWETLLARDWSDPRLPRAALLEQLRARPPQPGARASAWIVRAERADAEVLEERPAPTPEDPARVERSRWVLRRDGGQFRFASGLL